MTDTSENLYLTFDNGTSSSKVCIFDSEGNMLAKTTSNHKQITYNKCFYEHDPNEILTNCIQLIKTCVQKLEESNQNASKRIHSLGITNQRETLVVWNKNTGLPLYNAIVWIDGRTSQICEKLITKYGSRDFFKSKNGLLINTYFSLFKLIWLLENVKEVKTAYDSDELLFGTIDTWLVYNFTIQKHHFTDATNASRTFMYNIFEKKWDLDILKEFSIKASILPTVKYCFDDYGTLFIENLKHVKIACVMGDQQAAAFGIGVTKKGQSKVTYGTGSFIISHTGTQPILKDGLLTTILCAFPDGVVTYGFEASVESGGSSINFLKDNLNLFKNFDEMDCHLDENCSFDHQVFMLPFFSGVMAPHWEPNCPSIIYGLNFEHKHADFYRACLEGIAYRVTECIELFDDSSDGIIADGGLTNNPYFLNFQTALLKSPFRVSDFPDCTIYGVFLGCLMFEKKSNDHENLAKLLKNGKHIEKPDGEKLFSVQKKYLKYKQILKSTLEKI